mmetsp:Transcript_34803/g.100020  ORF Transcript_34803/g.100020 Transcript_34803/m.100020 type:complete len:81 (-) Transcript_34803:251-493(-)
MACCTELHRIMHRQRLERSSQVMSARRTHIPMMALIFRHVRKSEKKLVMSAHQRWMVAGRAQVQAQHQVSLIGRLGVCCD